MLLLFGSVYKDMNCIYSFSVESYSIDYVYIGQTQNLITRLNNHVSSMHNLGNTSNPLYSLNSDKDVTSMIFTVHFAIKNYQTLWLEQNSSITPEFLFILKAFNEYQLCIRELTLIHYYKPGLNVQQVAKFTFMNWKQGMKATLPSYINSPSFTSHLEYVFEHDNTQLTIFNFSLFYQLCQSTSINYNSGDSWLVWFIGYAEQRANFSLQRNQSCFSFYSSSQDFLSIIKSKLCLECVIHYTKKGDYALHITYRED